MALFDTSQFEGGLHRFERGMKDAIKQALGAAAVELLYDAGEKSPTVPKDTGRLRESGSAIVGRTVVATTQGQHAATEPGTPSTSPMPETSNGRSVAFVGFNTKYAAKVHNSPEMNFREPGSGAFYLQSKMRLYRHRYINAAAATFRRAAGTD